MRPRERAGGNGGRSAVLLLLLGTACMWTPPQYSFTPDEEVELGLTVAEQLNRSLPFVADTGVLALIQGVGDGLAGQIGRARRAFELRVVDRGSVNAFSLPGGFIYMNRGLIEATKNMAEIAGVISHEMAHVIAGHSAERVVHARRTRLGLTVSPAGTGDLGGVIFFANHHRLAEAEADSLAVGLMIDAGWDPAGLVSFFQSMLWLREHRPGAVQEPFLSHPRLEDRIENVRRIIEQIPEERRRGLRMFTLEYEVMKRALAGLPTTGWNAAAR
ncbi:MAG: M48 family metalloprotease [Gemmatimonadota bacterium]